MSTRTTRQGLATTVATAIGDAWTVQAAPPEVVTEPAAILTPRDPYIVRATARLWTLQLRLQLLVARTLGLDALDVLDDAIDALRPVLLARSDVTWSQVGGHSVVTEGAVGYIVATIDVAVTYDPEV